MVLQLGWAFLMLRAERWEWETKMRPVYGTGPIRAAEKGKAHLIGFKDMAATGESEQHRTKMAWEGLFTQGSPILFIAPRQVGGS